ncbi:MAG: cytochrome c3 family protein [Phycisphaerales bacterium]
MKRPIHWALAACALLAMIAPSAARAQFISVVDGPHNLSSGGGAAVRASVEDQVCIFCHAPHDASPIAALWNRSLAPRVYSVYTSRALEAQPGQPTGSSKLCLSCHDGTIALGAVLSRDTPIAMAGGVTTMPAGHANLGTDLRDDHPISFRFDSALASRAGHLRDPGTLPPEIKLDPGGELQCTSCHDAHNNAFGDFLVTRNTSSQLCNSCHAMGTTDLAAHQQCSSCHQSHTAPSGPYLLRRANSTDTCLSCHDGNTPGALNIATDAHKPYAHDTASPVDPPGDQYRHTSCTSCHDPHTMMRGVAASPPSLSGPRRTAFERLGRIDGVNSAGNAVQVASAEHEVCFKCHGDTAATTPTVPRRQQQNNLRLQFNPGAVSFHPVGSPGRSTEVPSLKPGWSTSSTMECSDCHASDTGATSGEHGSTMQGLLVSRYALTDRTSESAAAYALCYRCHDRTSILSDRSFSEHRKHIVEERTPCWVCHDSHGIGSAVGSITGNSHLVNFATTVVFPNNAGRLEYRDTGSYRGECYLSCHGENHSPLRYPDN